MFLLSAVSAVEIVLNPNDGNELPNIIDSQSFVRATVRVDNNLVAKKIGIVSITDDTADDFGTNKVYDIMFNVAI